MYQGCPKGWPFFVLHEFFNYIYGMVLVRNKISRKISDYRRTYINEIIIRSGYTVWDRIDWIRSLRIIGLLLPRGPLK